jgi:GT2 family glycosyltransferase
MAARPSRVDDRKTGVIDVSVCIANWNCRDMLRGCLQSLTDELQGIRLETIVVDNASTDGAADMVPREFPRVHLIRNQANRGFSRANNQAAATARGRFLFFLNNDTLVPPGTLRQLVDYLEAHPEVGMVGPRLRDGQGNVQVSYRPRPTVATLLHKTALFRWTGLFRSAYKAYRRREFDPNTTTSVDVLMGAAVLVARQRFLAWGAWDEDFTFGGEDMELSYRINRHAPVVFYPATEITHFGRSSTRQNIRFASLNIAIGLVQYLRKTGCSRRGILTFKLALTLDAPLQFIVKGGHYLIRCLCGQRQKAGKSLLAVRALGHFLTNGLLRFWKA